MGMNFDQKLSHVLDPSSRVLIYDAIWMKRITYYVGKQLQLFVGGYEDTKYPTLNVYIKGELVEIVLKPDGFMFTTFLSYNDDEVFDASDDLFVPYEADEAMLFQLSTIEDLKWLKPKHVKKFKRIYDFYSLT